MLARGRVCRYREFVFACLSRAAGAIVITIGGEKCQLADFTAVDEPFV